MAWFNLKKGCLKLVLVCFVIKRPANGYMAVLVNLLNSMLLWLVLSVILPSNRQGI